MLARPNRLQWTGQSGHYEVYYVTLTDRASGIGFWIRYTLLAPLDAAAQPPTCALWFLAMDPVRRQTSAALGTFPIELLQSVDDPFELRIGDAWLSERGMGASVLPDAEWNLRWMPSPSHYEHVDPLLRRARLAQTVLVLPQADLAIDGTISFAGRSLEVRGARGAQAHLWGTKHASSWAWAHCNDLTELDGTPADGAFMDAVSVLVSRFGREVGPSTPVLARIDGQDFRSTTPWRVVGNHSRFALTGWQFDAVDGARRLMVEVDADRDLLAGVTYHDPDGEPAYCYNTETASIRIQVYERARRVGGWAHRKTLVGRGRAHFEYASRTPVPGLELLTA
jgi:hypothetical protein